jgi:tetratricopeptide (TPR) repeat protein
MPNPQDQNNFPDTQRQVIFLSGKVMLDDGTPPPQGVVIERVCNGVPRAEGYADAKGRFSFQLGNNNEVFQDASMGGGPDPLGGGGAGGFGRQSSRNPIGGVSERALFGCDLRAALPGYHSEVVNLSNRHSLDNPDVGVILLHRMGHADGQLVSATLLAAPKDAKKAYEKGVESLKRNKTEDAVKNFQKAVEIYPQHAAAWTELGKLQILEKQTDAARESFAAAMKADAKYMPPYMQLSLLEARSQKWQDLADITERLLKLDAYDYPQAYFFNAVANYNMHNFEPAEKSAREAQKLDTAHQFPQIAHVLGLILAERHDMAGAAEQMRAYLNMAPSAPDAGQVRSQLEEMEKTAKE